MLAKASSALPRSGLSLTALGMGCAVIGGLYIATSEADARAALDEAWALGLRYFDTAPYYGFTLSEHRLGAALRERPRDEYVISTKVGRLMKPDKSVRAGESDWAAPLPFRPMFDYSYDGIMRSHEDSLQRLGLTHIDVLFVHDIGRITHADRHDHYWGQLTVGGGFKALDDLRRSGQVSAIGLGVNEWEVVYASMQEIDLDCTLLAGRYTLLEQASLSPLLDACQRDGNAIVIGGPFNSGILAGNPKYNYMDAPADIVLRVKELEAVCLEFAVPLPAAALQFPMAHPAVVSCIPGGKDVAQLRQNVAWFDMPIPTELWTTLKSRGLIDERAPVPVNI
ncbi:aldo/keto reductase [Glaciimonas sp. CA11.2]|uniref:aldo/keto reductase n=1 Tax=unclassified Glaciimonas TaxID=2644401 RepID=UPI002AB36D88|nr:MULTISPECIES: aldo/keto reductase [unclassified Glaciimonas]MDY7546613.1 aldo/keto reductase [Glaciimonas sp. CA11.2]MEB0011739.1 aldo/keto reductase [Glaciimonas sp. Cout2]MEB0080705.1 aldo/keto reductase [Glaciimonas sp. Gout2]MEB0163039.1 aldo/keto reductase [Glaciimonas sp. CA11.2]